MAKEMKGILGAELPLIQGGMGVGISLSGLASAVANQGGIGVIAVSGIGISEPDYKTNFKEANIRALKKEIQIAKEKTKNNKGKLGINALLALSDVNELVKTANEEKIDYIFLGAGIPLSEPKIIFENKDIKTKIIPIVSSARVADVILRRWLRHDMFPAAFVVEGPKAGGHLGFKLNEIDDPEFALEKIIPRVLEVVSPFAKLHNVEIPVIAAGGIYTGEDIYKYIQMGASGVQMATRFVGTEECDASPEFKRAYIDCTKNDLIIIDSPVGLPGRAIRNEFLDEVLTGTRYPTDCPWQCLSTCDVINSPYCIARALINAKEGNLKDGFCFAGSNAYLVKEIVTVEQLINTLVREYREASQRSSLLSL